MRDDAFKRIGDNGKYSVVRVENNYSKDIYRYDNIPCMTFKFTQKSHTTRKTTKIIMLLKLSVYKSFRPMCK